MGAVRCYPVTAIRFTRRGLFINSEQHRPVSEQHRPVNKEIKMKTHKWIGLLCGAYLPLLALVVVTLVPVLVPLAAPGVLKKSSSNLFEPGNKRYVAAVL
jgi:hypothetical protein